MVDSDNKQRTSSLSNPSRLPSQIEPQPILVIRQPQPTVLFREPKFHPKVVPLVINGSSPDRPVCTNTTYFVLKILLDRSKIINTGFLGDHVMSSLLRGVH